MWSKAVKWFGYYLHLIVDTDYELPVAFKVTKAFTSEVKQAHKMIVCLGQTQSQLLKNCEVLMADRGYDDQKLHKKLWNDYRIKWVIDIRNMWGKSDKTVSVKLLWGKTVK